MIIFPGLIGSIARAGKTAVAPPAGPLVLGSASSINLNSFQTYGESYISVIGTGTEILTVTKTGDEDLMPNFSVSSSPTSGGSVSGGNTITIMVTYIGFGSSASANIQVSLSGGSMQTILVSYF